MKNFICQAARIAILSLASYAIAASKPNVVLITVDDLRPELGTYGCAEVKSPNIDRLAEGGVLFESAYCQQAVCLPSRVSLNTGMRPQSTGVRDLQTKFRKALPNAKTIGQVLKDSGYRTAAMGKVYHDEQPAEWDHWVDPKKNPGFKEYHLDDIVASGGEKVKGPSCESADRPDSEYHDGILAGLAVEELKRAKANPSQPLFLSVGFRKPHLPFVAPKQYWDLYDRSSIRLPALRSAPKGAPEIALTTRGELRAYTDISKEGPLDDAKTIELIHGYRASVSFVDAQIGKVIDALDSLGMRDNTIVILWGDHGWKLGDYGMWCKHTNFELDTRVPLIIRAPGNKAGARVSSFVELTDILPTICELSQATIPETCEGRSLVSLFDGEGKVRDYAFSEFKRERKTGGDIVGYSIRNASFRYTEWINEQTGKTAATELYDHSRDHSESVNLAKDPAYAAAIRELSPILLAEAKKPVAN